MRLGQVNKYVNLTTVQIRLTPDLVEHYSKYVNNMQEDVWLVGHLMGDFFISPSHPTDKTRRLWCIPEEVEPKDFLDCKVLQILD